MARKLLKIKIHGHVQGVGFRFEAMQKARELRLVGFARNERDHTVYIEAQGDRENLEKFLHWCEFHGPRFAEVTKVESKFTNDFKNYQTFRAVY
ncbi:MAG: acylphosphatase [Patescibacteria group bacterium]|nr:acylphosphatase [Patescibacteria group bacterium]